MQVSQKTPDFQCAKKPAELETGASVMVPLFINTGEMIKVDTRDRSYSERVKK